ncbi:MAG TPA: hypothetical protein VHR66_17665 [Gemmataceae bacterium]|jgi:hypothetical protein|nr:hypothetical protein [Gemmataceae bacterium]
MSSRIWQSSLALVIALGLVAAGSPLAGQEKPVKPGTDPAKPGEKPAKPSKPDGGKLPGASGTVKAIDAAKGTLTISIATKGGATNDETYALDKETKITVDGKEGKLADVKAGLHAGVMLTADKSKAVAVKVEGPTFNGELKSVDASKHTVVVSVVTHDPTDKKKTSTEDKTFKVADDASVAIKGKKPATLADLKAGTTVAVHVSADGERAIAIYTIVKQGPSFAGELKEVSADKKSVKVAVTVLAVKGDKSSGKIEEKTFNLADDVSVAVEGKKPAKVEDLKVGSHVTVQLAAEGDKAVAIYTQTKGEKKPEKP